MRVNETIEIDDAWIEEHFVRASGPGGQNVNKVASAVQLRFNARGCSDLPPYAKAKLIRIAGYRATNDGIIIIEAKEFRDQPRNRTAARERLLAMILEALERPKRRVPTRPTLASKRRRIEGKQKRSRLKSTRGRVRSDD